MSTITPDSLMTLEAYARARPTMKPEIIAHRRLSSVALGEHVTLQFEDERTIRYQIQEMLRIEKIFEPDAVQGEIDAYAPMVPDGGNWKATMLIEFPDPNERKRELARLIGVEDRLFVEVEGQSRVYAIAHEDLRRRSSGSWRPRSRSTSTSSTSTSTFSRRPGCGWGSDRPGVPGCGNRVASVPFLIQGSKESR